MLLTVVSATPFEIAPFREYLNQHFEQKSPNVFQKKESQVHLVVTGVGLTHAAFAMGKYLSSVQPDLLINAGIAGSFNDDFAIGDVVNVVSEQFGDLGVEEADGRFTNVHEMGLIPENELPFTAGRMLNKAASFLPSVHGLTIHKVHGTEKSIAAIKAKYDVDIESMEGAAIFYACLIEKISFLEIRAISNKVEPRNRENWNLPLAITRLNEVLLKILEEFC